MLNPESRQASEPLIVDEKTAYLVKYPCKIFHGTGSPPNHRTTTLTEIELEIEMKDYLDIQK